MIWAVTVLNDEVKTTFELTVDIINFQVNTNDVASIPRDGPLDRFYVRMIRYDFKEEDAIAKAVSTHILSASSDWSGAAVLLVRMSFLAPLWPKTNVAHCIQCANGYHRHFLLVIVSFYSEIHAMPIRMYSFRRFQRALRRLTDCMYHSQCERRQR